MFRINRGNNHLNSQEKGAIIGCHSAGQSIRLIARNNGFSQKTVARWVNRYEETGDVERKVGSGRPSKLSPAQLQMLVDAVAAKPITTAQELGGNFLFHSYNNEGSKNFLING